MVAKIEVKDQISLENWLNIMENRDSYILFEPEQFIIDLYAIHKSSKSPDIDSNYNKLVKWIIEVNWRESLKSYLKIQDIPNHNIKYVKYLAIDISLFWNKDSLCVYWDLILNDSEFEYDKILIIYDSDGYGYMNEIESWEDIVGQRDIKLFWPSTYRQIFDQSKVGNNADDPDNQRSRDLENEKEIDVFTLIANKFKQNKLELVLGGNRLEMMDEVFKVLFKSHTKTEIDTTQTIVLKDLINNKKTARKALKGETVYNYRKIYNTKSDTLMNNLIYMRLSLDVDIRYTKESSLFSKGKISEIIHKSVWIYGLKSNLYYMSLYPISVYDLLPNDLPKIKLFLSNPGVKLDISIWYLDLTVLGGMLSLEDLLNTVRDYCNWTIINISLISSDTFKDLKRILELMLTVKEKQAVKLTGVTVAQLLSILSETKFMKKIFKLTIKLNVYPDEYQLEMIQQRVGKMRNHKIKVQFGKRPLIQTNIDEDESSD